MQAKLRDAQEQKVPVMVVVGDRDQEARAVSPACGPASRSRACRSMRSWPTWRRATRPASSGRSSRGARPRREAARLSAARRDGHRRGCGAQGVARLERRSAHADRVRHRWRRTAARPHARGRGDVRSRRPDRRSRRKRGISRRTRRLHLHAARRPARLGRRRRPGTGLIIATPAGLETFLEEFHAAPDWSARDEVAARHGLRFPR